MSMRDNKLHIFIAGKGRLSKYDRGQIVQTTEDQATFNLIKSGYIKRYLIKNDGSLSVDLIYGPGDVFSLTLIFTALFNRNILDSKETYHYEAMTPASVYSLDVRDLGEYAKRDTIIYKDLLSEAGKRMTSATQGLENKSMKNSYKKVAHQLAFYARRFGYRRSVGIEILPPFTHQDLADILSLTRETVSTSMSRLKKEKLIKTSKKIIIPSLEKLEELANS